MPLEHAQIAHALGELARARGARVAAAESCTGGLIAATCTAVPRSSDWFEGALVTYRLSAKRRLLAVSEETLARSGAVSEATVTAMARGVFAACDATHCVAVTGLAGPSTDGSGLPVGTVWFAWAARAEDHLITRRIEFDGDREKIRSAATRAALEGLIDLIEAH